ncbi:hypothetical protein [Nonomuraea cypriaca]|nr:hypothetical protein [Nonomuraea cypriaca]
MTYAMSFGCACTGLCTVEGSLEEAFMELTADKHQSKGARR